MSKQFIVKSEKSAGFGIVYDIYLSECSPIAFKLICFLCRVKNKEGKSYYSIDRLRTLKNSKGKNIISSNRNSIVKAFKELKELGFIDIEKGIYNTITIKNINTDYDIFDSIKSDTFISIKSDTFISIESDTETVKGLTNNSLTVSEIEKKVKKVIGLTLGNYIDKYKYEEMYNYIVSECKKRIKTIKNIEAYIKGILKSCKKNYRLSNDKVILPDNPAIINQKESESKEDWSIEYDKLRKEGKSAIEIAKIMGNKYNEEI